MKLIILFLFRYLLLFLLNMANITLPSFLKKNTAFPFKDHAQFPVLTDILIRRHMHHVILQAQFTSSLHHSFIEAFLQHLAQDHIPPALKHAELIYLDIENLNLTEQKDIKKDIEAMRASLDHAEKYLLLAISNCHLFSKKKLKEDALFLRQQLETLFYHPKCRLILLNQAPNISLQDRFKKQFTNLRLSGPTETDIATVLKQQRSELEAFHHVLIPEETLTLAYLLASRYLSPASALDEALLLLDSSAARLNTIEKSDQNNTNKPILTSHYLLQVLSHLTLIPTTHLQLHKFKLHEFMQHLEQRVFGQETALALIGQTLQLAQIHLEKSKGPYAHFLFAGPHHTGKETTALALTEFLFKQTHMFYSAEIGGHRELNSILDLTLYHHSDQHGETMKNILKEKPYAVFFLKNIEESSPTLLQNLYDILNTGFLYHEGKPYQFKQAIFLLSTTKGASRLTESAETLSHDEENEPVDLMELIMREQKSGHAAKASDNAAQEFIRDILSELANDLPLALCQKLHVIPFLLPQKPAIQNIIHLKLKQLGKLLDARFGIELGYAPEVIRYLSQGYPCLDINRVLNQLYATIEQALFSQLENKNRPNQLFLQLNETGQSLRCDWLAMPTMRHHAT